MNLRTFKKGLFVLPLLAPVFAGAAVKFFNPVITDSIPKTLSATGIYTNIANKTLDTALKYFEVNSALWSDAAHKDRWIILPPGTSLNYVDTTDVFNYPEGTIFVKLFSHDTIPGNPNSRIPWETRLLIKKTSEGNLWHGVTYKWNANGTEARLVDLGAGLDTVVTIATPHSRYRKWHFPSQADCYRCHRQHTGTRGVLGFLPAQLKRRLTNPNKNQIDHLFDIGVFKESLQYPRPNAFALGRRWRGMGEPIPTGLSPDERFKVIDTMARAYIAANCSGCHGTTGIADGAIEHAPYLNYDFYNLRPMMEFGAPGNTSPRALDLTDIEGAASRWLGRPRMIMSLNEWGIDHSAGANFDMKRPWFPPAGSQRLPGLISAGYPSFSTGIYRQMARNSPKYDSLSFRLNFAQNGDGLGWSNWIFKAPWGSQAWLDTLKGRNVSLMTVLNTQAFESRTAFSFDAEAMPPLATYIPDTAAMKILAEWARTYRTLVKMPGEDSVYVTRLNAAVARAKGVPSIRNGMLIAPEGWTGKASMISLNGRSWNLPSAGRGRYVLPVSAPAGVYVFRIGTQVFRTSLVR